MAGARQRNPDATLVGVIGSPIAHSLSPLLHNAAFAALGLNWLSSAFEVAPGAAAGALEDMRAADVVGLSVTMPHKAEVARLVQERSETAARLEAVNCVLIRDGAFFGANTDGEGFVTSLARGAAFDPAGARCLVIGAGGAARAVVLALAGAGASDVVVLNRTPARAAEAAALAGASGRVSGVDQVADVAQADLVVNATPAGMEGTDQGTPASGWPVDPSLLHQGQVVVDLVYAPRPTAWLKAAAESGATTVDGLGMLVHQAAAQIALWTGLRPPVDAMWQAATRAV